MINIVNDSIHEPSHRQWEGLAGIASASYAHETYVLSAHADSRLKYSIMSGPSESKDSSCYQEMSGGDPLINNKQSDHDTQEEISVSANLHNFLWAMN